MIILTVLLAAAAPVLLLPTVPEPWNPLSLPWCRPPASQFPVGPIADGDEEVACTFGRAVLERLMRDVSRVLPI
jgi:hypothetical protein